MGRKLTGDITPTPVVAIKATKNGFMEGVFLGNRREVTLKKGKGVVYEFSIEKTDLPIQIKNNAGEYVEAKVKKGDTVSVFAPTVLDAALRKAMPQERIRVVYLGEKKNYHNFDVEVI